MTRAFSLILCFGIVFAAAGTVCQEPAGTGPARQALSSETVYLQHPRGNAVSFPVLEREVNWQPGTTTRKEAVEYLARELGVTFIISPDFDCVCHMKEFWAEKLAIGEDSVPAREVLRRIWKGHKIALRAALVSPPEGAGATRDTILIVPQHVPVAPVEKIDASTGDLTGDTEYQPMDFPGSLYSMLVSLPENKHRQISYDEQLTAVTIKDSPENIKEFKLLLNVSEGKTLPAIWQ